ncbi:MAG: 30S ribosomal protein S16 [bacterium]
MSVVIRLARHGSKKNPFYRIVVTDKRFAGDGNSLEQLGTYDPREKPQRIEILADRLQEWLKRGALPSPTVAQLIKKSGVMRAPDAAPGETP